MSGGRWDADTYDKVADPQEAWAREILQRFALRGDERVLDAGCGSGRVTELLVERLPRGRVVAVDADAAMVAKARERLGDRADVQQQDLLELQLPEPVDAVFSCAVFHWITDHERLFERLRAALGPGGRLVAQCGGHGNIAKVVAAVPDRPSPWLYATPEGTEHRLRAAGFAHARAWLEPKPTRVADPQAYVAAICLHGHPQAQELAPNVVAALGDPPVIDYVRLNIHATV
ncbi:MAG TPA: methyltransferase domain-containing protein [Solirubrobacteraceae bacterium]|nr:methyltransferase domain-containing protein [Solirubrobacteraceae bacterium]